MSRTTVRIGTYCGLGGFIIGSVFGVWLALSAGSGNLHYWKADSVAHAQVTREELLLSEFDLTDVQVDKALLVAGGPAKDGIPSLTNPPTVLARDVDFLGGDDRIIAVTIGGQSRAYPNRMLNWHEAVNDELGGVPIAVVYCPLCDSVTVVDRRINGETLTFSISGLLYQSNVLLYDREHGGLWSQILLEAISGPFAGQTLVHYGWDLTTFFEWRERLPDGAVVTFDTGITRDYSRNPYANYFESDGLLFSVKNEDERLNRKARIVGIRVGDVYRAYPVEAIFNAQHGRLIDEIGGQQVVLVGDAASGRVAVQQQPPDAIVVHTFWFTWAAVHPHTESTRASIDTICIRRECHMKVGIIVLADTETKESLGRVVNALIAAREFKDAGDDVRVIFDGAGVKWPARFAKPDQQYRELYDAVQDKVTGICEYCAGAFGVEDQLNEVDAPLAGEHDGHPSFRQLVQEGFAIITF